MTGRFLPYIPTEVVGKAKNEVASLYPALENIADPGGTPIAIQEGVPRPGSPFHQPKRELQKIAEWSASGADAPRAKMGYEVSTQITRIVSDTVD